MKIEIELSETEILTLKNDLLDVEEWVRNAVRGKVNNCKKRMLQQWVPKLLSDPEVEALPANEEKLINMICENKNYKNRSQREAEAE